MSTTYIVPQVLVFQEFELVPEAITAPLRALIMGPQYQLVRYTAAGEKATGLLGEYDPTQQECYDWPGRQAGAVVDQDYTRIFIDDALLQYFYNPASGADTIKGTHCDTVDLYNNTGSAKNLIRAAATNWKTSGAYARAVALRNRDVQVGDVAKISAVVGMQLVTLWTYVAGFVSDKIAEIIGAAVEDANNVSASIVGSSSQTPNAVVTKIGYATNDVDITDFSEPANRPEFAYQDGVQADIYTFEVIEGGDATQVVLRVTTESGTDDVDELTLTAYGAAAAFGVKGLSVTFGHIADDFVVGMKWEAVVEFGIADVDPVSGGTYDGTTDTTYIIEVTRGGTFGATLPPQITVSTADGSDVSGPHSVDALDTPIEIGSHGVTVEFTSHESSDMGLYLGDRYYIPVVAAKAGAVKTLLFGHNLPDELLGITGGVCGVPPALAVTLYIKKDIEVPEGREGFAPLVNWIQSATEICLEDGIIAYDASWIDDDDEMLPLPVKGGTAYAHYRALLSTYAGTVYAKSEGDSIDLGPEVPDNPLAFGVFLAGLNANGTAVKFIATDGTDLAAYQEALDMLTERDDLYSVVPLTFDTTIIQAAIAHVNAMSAADTGRWRSLIISTVVSSEKSILTQDDEGDVLLATIEDDPDTSGDQYTLVECVNDVEFIGTVAAGDILRTGYTTDGFGNIQYDEYVVDAVLSETSLRLVSGPDAPVTVAQKIEVWRNLTTTEHAEEIAARANVYNSRRICNVWPDYFERDSESIAGYFLGCIVAGQRSGVVPHQGLTNVEIVGVSSASRTTMFSRSELNTIAAAGVYIIAQLPDGSVFCRQALTTDMTDINSREEVVVRNVDAISYTYLRALAPYIGLTNITPSNLVVIRDAVESTTTYIRNETQTPTLGAQINDATITRLEQDSVFRDRLNIDLDVELPYPLNNIELHLFI